MIKRLLPLDRAQWFPDRMILGDLVFRLEHYKNDDWDLGDQCLAFFKVRGLVDQYQEFWALRPSFRAENVVELGRRRRRLLVRDARSEETHCRRLFTPRRQ